MSTLYLAWSSSGTETLRKHKDDEPVDLLVAYPELKSFEKARKGFNVRRWVLDSGAFSVFNRGATIDVNEYVAACRDVDAAEIFALDVIGDTAASQRNYEIMWAAGVHAIPTYHYGEPWEGLKWCADRAPKIALGGIAKRRGVKRNEWIQQSVARVWPKKIHCFGMASLEFMQLAPFHSVDASSWVVSPQRFGNFAGYSGKQYNFGTQICKNVKDYWVEVIEHKRRAAWAAERWRNELALLEELDHGGSQSWGTPSPPS